jgi:hypothetical protein
MKFCSHHHVIAKQVLESPNEFRYGRMWFGLSSMVHSYSYSLDTNKFMGRQIWKKHECVLDANSFLDREKRSDYIQALEPGEFIAIRLPDLYWLIEHYPMVKNKIELIARVQHRYFDRRIQLLNKPAPARVKQFELDNPLFSRIASNTVKAIHTGLTRQGYERLLKKIQKGQ